MAYHYIGALLVVYPDGTLLGIVTERDLAYALHKFGARAYDIPVEDIMSKAVISCDSNTSVARAVELMLNNEIRHLPVKDGELLKGVISMRDVMGDRLVELELENETLRELMAA